MKALLLQTAVLMSLGASAMAGTVIEIKGRAALALTDKLVAIEALETQESESGYGIKTGKFVCNRQVEEQSGDPRGPVEYLELVDCSVHQTFKANITRNGKDVEEVFQQDQEIGNATDIYTILRKAGATSKGDQLILKSLDCHVTVERQQGDPEGPSSILPTAAECRIIQQ